MDFALALSTAVGRYSLEVAGKDEHLALLRWQMGQGHRLDLRAGHADLHARRRARGCG